jgi:hypothetical protein
MKDKDLTKMYELLVKGNSAADIATIMSISVKTVYSNIAKHFPYLKDVKTFSDNKELVFSGLQKMSIGFIVKKLPSASFADLTKFFDMIDTRCRLAGNKATSNHAFKIERVVEQRDALVNKQLANAESLEAAHKLIATQYSLPDSSQVKLASVPPDVETEACEHSLLSFL